MSSLYQNWLLPGTLARARCCVAGAAGVSGIGGENTRSGQVESPAIAPSAEAGASPCAAAEMFRTPD